MMKTYTELSCITDYRERFEYLKIQGKVGQETFGHARWLNQYLYNTPEWDTIRRKIILRDDGCDMGLVGFPINGPITVHHIVPITLYDIQNRNPLVYNADNLVCVSHLTHNAIHYGDVTLLSFYTFIERQPNDTCPWR